MIPVYALVLALLLAACATAPAGMGPAFEQAMSAARADTNPYAADATLSDLLSSASLSDDQRALALYARGSLRRQAGDDRRGAVRDFEDMLKLAPDHPLVPNAKDELEFARSDVETIEAGLKRMLNLYQWFDSMWVLGDRDAARSSSLQPPDMFAGTRLAIRQSTRWATCGLTSRTCIGAPGRTPDHRIN